MRSASASDRAFAPGSSRAAGASAGKQPRLSSTIVAPPALSARQRDAMFEIFARHYDEVSRERFESDLAEKDAVVLLEDAEGVISGFSTQQVLSARAGGRRIRALFSGDTVIDRSHWGEQELCRGWSRYAGRVLAEEPDTPLYWFLISKGFRTYLYLPLFFRTFYPCAGTATPAFEQHVLDAIASAKFAGDYDPATGLIVFPRSQGQLTGELASVPLHRQRDEHVRFFLSRNPRYAEGEELACLAEISPDNLNAFGRRLFEGQAAW